MLMNKKYELVGRGKACPPNRNGEDMHILFYLCFTSCVLCAGCDSFNVKQAAINEIRSRKLEFSVEKFHEITASNQTENITLFIKAGMAPDAKLNEMTPLMYACCVGNLEAVKTLLKAGADIEAFGFGGMTPLMHAAWKGNGDIVGYLLETGANPNVKVHMTGGLSQGHYVDQPTLRYAVESESVEVVRLLLKQGTIVNSGEPPALIEAIQLGNTSMVRELIKAGAEIDVKSRSGESPKDLAQRLGNSDIMNIIKAQ